MTACMFQSNVTGLRFVWSKQRRKHGKLARAATATMAEQTWKEHHLQKSLVLATLFD